MGGVRALSTASHLLDAIKFEHTVFALPFAYIAMILAAGVFHNLVIVSIRKRYPGQARKVMTALWGMGLMMLAKTIIVVSDHVNVHDLSEVAWRVTNNIDPARDLVIVEGPTDDLDHAALRHRYGGKLGIDATEKRAPLDRVEQPWPDEIRMSDEVRERVARRWREYGFG